MVQGSDKAARIRPTTANDRPLLLDILRRTAFFSPEEIDVALELIDAWLAKPDQRDYLVYTADLAEEDGGGRVAGYVCFGPTPATDATFDLYWIAVDPTLQSRGIGKALVGFVEQEVRKRAGRMIIIETSSTERYGSTQAFYTRQGYRLEARIDGFYRAGDDRLIFVKRFGVDDAARRRG